MICVHRHRLPGWTYVNSPVRPYRDACLATGSLCEAGSLRLIETIDLRLFFKTYFYGEVSLVRIERNGNNRMSGDVGDAVVFS